MTQDDLDRMLETTPDGKCPRCGRSDVTRRIGDREDGSHGGGPPNFCWDCDEWFVQMPEYAGGYAGPVSARPIRPSGGKKARRR